MSRWKHEVTLKSIEKAGYWPTRRATEEARSSYLAKYGIHNLWQAWLMRTDSRLNERTQDELCGYQAENDEA